MNLSIKSFIDAPAFFFLTVKLDTITLILSSLKLVEIKSRDSSMIWSSQVRVFVTTQMQPRKILVNNTIRMRSLSITFYLHLLLERVNVLVRWQLIVRIYKISVIWTCENMISNLAQTELFLMLLGMKLRMDIF